MCPLTIFFCISFHFILGKSTSHSSIFDLVAKFQENANHMDVENENQPTIESENPNESEVQAAKKVERFEWQLERTFDDEKSCMSTLMVKNVGLV